MKLQHGRDVDTLLADGGMLLPRDQRPAKTDDGFRPGPRRPWWRGGAGQMPGRAPVAQYRMTTQNAAALWPFVATSGLTSTGVEMGYQLSAGSRFFFDPVGWTRAGAPVTNTAVACFGHPGTGKSGVTKAFAMRAIPFGYRVMVLGDTKNEYEPLCKALGQEPVSVFVGGFARINPLDPGPLAAGWDELSGLEQQRRMGMIKTRWLALLQSLVTSQKISGVPVPYGPSEDEVLGRVLDDLVGVDGGDRRELAPLTIPMVWWQLYQPKPALWQACRFESEQAFLDGTRTLRDSLGALVRGRLKGLFDAPTTVRMDWDAPIQSIGLAGLKAAGEDAVAVALACINSWGTGFRMVQQQRLTIDIRDELWRILSLGPGAVHSVSADVRLSRAEGSVQWLVSHQPADFSGVGGVGSEQAEVGRSLVQMCGTKILLGQEQAVAEELGQILDLGAQCGQALTGWGMQGRGRAVWCLGKRRQVRVVTPLTALENQLYYTNSALES